MKIPKLPFKAVCIKEFKSKDAWGCLELLRIYEFTEKGRKYENIITTVKVTGNKETYQKGSYHHGFFVTVKKSNIKNTVPYFFDHFIILKEK